MSDNSVVKNFALSSTGQTYPIVDQYSTDVANGTYANYFRAAGNSYTTGGRNLMTVLGTSTADETCTALRSLIKTRDYRDLRIGDYLAIPLTSIDGSSTSTYTVQIFDFDHYTAVNQDFTPHILFGGKQYYTSGTKDANGNTYDTDAIRYGWHRNNDNNVTLVTGDSNTSTTLASTIAADTYFYNGTSRYTTVQDAVDAGVIASSRLSTEALCPYLTSELHYREINEVLPRFSQTWQDGMYAPYCYLEQRKPTSTTSKSTSNTGATWASLGKIFSLSEVEVYGRVVRGDNTNGYNALTDRQVAIFRGGNKSHYKGDYWWLRSVSGGYSTYACFVDHAGNAYYTAAANTYVRMLPCFCLKGN